jgi:tRNA threonylcarbamoyladenosine biosynthesis protein TsaE
VLESYESGGQIKQMLWHFDFYRFNDPQEWEDAGFRDIFAGPGLKLVEWPQHVAGHLPTPDVRLHLIPALDGSRQVRLEAFTPQGQDILNRT